MREGLNKYCLPLSRFSITFFFDFPFLIEQFSIAKTVYKLNNRVGFLNRDYTFKMTELAKLYFKNEHQKCVFSLPLDTQRTS